MRIARYLNAAPERLEYLDALPVPALRRLREQIIERDSARVGTRVRSLVRSERFFSARLTAHLVARHFDPILTARLVGEMPVERAAAIGVLLPVRYLGRVAVHMNPFQMVALLRTLPSQVVAAAARELADRGQYVVMGRFIGALDDDTLRLAIGRLSESEMLEIGFVMEQRERLSAVIRLMTASQRRRFLEVIYAEDRWAVGFELISEFDSDQRAEFGVFLTELGEGAIAAFIAAVERERLWDELTPILISMGPASVDRLARSPGFWEPRVLESVFWAMVRIGSWKTFLPMLRHATPVGLALIGRLVPTIDDEVIWDALASADDQATWEELMIAVRESPPEGLVKFIQLAVDRDPHVAELCFEAAIADGLIHRGLTAIVDVVEPAELARLVSAFPVATFISLIRAADQHELWPALLRLIAHLGLGARARLCGLAVMGDARTLDGLLSAVVEHGLWPDLLGLIPLLAPAGERHISESIAELPVEALQAAVPAIHAARHWAAAVALVAALPAPARARVSTAMSDAMDDKTLTALIDGPATEGLWRELVQLMAAVGPTIQARMVPILAQLSGSIRRGLWLEAQACGLADRLGVAGAVLSAAD